MASTAPSPLSHGASHELALLERFVGERVQSLPRLASARPHELPPRSAAYHTSCAALLRDVLRVLAPLSPRLAQLVAQIWELTSLNVFVLVQLAQTALQDKDAALAKWRQLQRFCDETTAQHATRVAGYETELDRARVEARELRAELQKTRQRANRLGVENAQLRKAVHGLMEMNDTLHGRMESGGTGEKLDDTPVGAMGVGGDAEEWELYGVSAEELDKLDVVHPIESYAQDFDQLFEGLFDRAREQLALLNETDRFMNSSVVSLLWRHGPDEDHTKFLQQMMSKRTAGTQTEDDALGLLGEEEGSDQSDADDDDEGEHDNNHRHSHHHLSGETGSATLVTKRQLLPPALRAQLTTRPRITRVMDKAQLSRVVLLLLVDKMESDARALRATPFPTPRAPLHRFLKDFFLARYGIVSLAEFRMMEVVKSALYYHEKQEAEARRLRQITGTSSSASSSQLTAVEDPDAVADAASAFSLLPGLEALSLGSDDLRVALFARLCELVPLQWRASQIAPPAGNLFACATNALVDFLGDVVELDRASPTLRDVVERQHASDWELSFDTAALLVAHHFSHCELPRLELLRRRLARLVASGAATSSLAPVSVDSLLVFFVTQWFEVDQKLTAALHDAFHRETARQHALATSYSTYGRETNPTSPMETLKRVWRALPGEHVSLAEMDELERAFEVILELRQSQQLTQHQRRVSKRQSVAQAAGSSGSSSSSSRPGSAAVNTAAPSAVGLCVGGISEKEFVFQSQQILRARRVCRGLRTNGRGVAVVSVAPVDATSPSATIPQAPVLLGPRGRPLEGDAVSFAIEELKAMS